MFQADILKRRAQKSDVFTDICTSAVNDLSMLQFDIKGKGTLYI